MVKRSLLSVIFILFTVFAVFTAGAQTASETPKGKEVVGNLELGLVVFLCFHDARADLDNIKGEVGAVAANFKGAVESVYVSGDDKQEDALRAKFKTQPNDTAVFIILPTGAAAAKLEGANITKSNLMRAVVSSCGGGGCGSGGGGCGS
ncbi:MAG: hypothetical protein HQL30_09645 [Candidatus Omnitrophica bacterium]|nr:hypothetical protein [Candidatus Omnitrophota bacterium]